MIMTWHHRLLLIISSTHSDVLLSFGNILEKFPDLPMSYHTSLIGLHSIPLLLLIERDIRNQNWFFHHGQKLLHFTPDDKYIVCGRYDDLQFWGIAGKEITKFRRISYNRSIKKYMKTGNIALNSQRLIVVAYSSTNNGLYITSWECQKEWNSTAINALFNINL